MVGFTPRISPAVRLFVALAVGGLAPAPALAAVSTTSAVPLQYFFVVQPVDVCTDNPRAGVTTDCAYINNGLQTVLSSPTGANTLVGFLDPATNMLAHRNIWSAIGVDYRQTPVVQYKSTISQTLTVSCPTGTTTGCTSTAFNMLIQQPGIANGNTPTFPRNSSPTTINMFFVKKICSSSTSCGIDGFGALNGNGIAIANPTFFPQSIGVPDAPAHEQGHNLDLDHATFGAGGLTNLMTAGASRMVPLPLPASGSNMDQWVTEVSPNAAPASQLDLLTAAQQSQVVLSGFLNASPAASTSLSTGECCAPVRTALASTPSPTPPPIHYVISNGFNDACSASPICANASLAEVVIVLTEGIFDNSSGHSFQIFGQTPNPVLAEPPQIMHGNNGNDACQSQGPTVWCLDLKFVPGFDFLDFTIGTKPATIDGLAGTVCYFWESPAGTPYYNTCADLSSEFGSLFSDSQLANLAINPLLPLTFAGTPLALPCTTTATSCPDPTSTYTNDSHAKPAALHREKRLRSAGIAHRLQPRQ